MRPLFVCLLASAAALGNPGPPAGERTGGPGQPARLSKEDRALLDSLLRDVLFDPRGAARVRVPLSVPYLFRPFYSYAEARDGWLVRGTAGQPDRVYFTDGASIPAPPPERIKPIHFFANCRWRYRTADGLRVTEFVYDENSDLAVATWLYRLGHEDLAAKALARVRARTEEKKDPRQVLRSDLADRAFEALHDAFCARADEEALAHGERLLCPYADCVAERVRPAAEAMVADLLRRRAAGTFGRKPPASWPAGFDAWDAKKKLDYLIATLDEIDTDEARELDYIPAVLRRKDRRLEALIGLGEMAIPALLDVMDTDPRLTRVPERGGRDNRPTGRIIPVQNVAYQAIRSILRVSEFDPTAGDGPDPRPEEVRMRVYWETYGRLPFDQRMMKVLTDPDANPNALRECAENLAWPDGVRDRRWDRTATDDTAARQPNPAVQKFRGPTAAEAILGALDRERRARDARPSQFRDSWEGVEGRYLDHLVELGDQGIGPELARRAAATRDVATRRRFALAAHRLGSSGAWYDLARDVERGTLPLAWDPDREDRVPHPADVLAELISALLDSGLPDADRVVYALADVDHPFAPVIAHAVLGCQGVFDRHWAWRQHPFCLAVLRRGLDDERPTGLHYYLRADEIERSADRPADHTAHRHWEQTRRGPGLLALPAHRPNPKGWREHAEERACDVVAERLVGLLAGLPEYHPLHSDADRSLAAIKVFLDRRGRGFRRLTAPELVRFGFQEWEPAYVPDIRPLGRPATSADAAAGRSVFHLDGKGRPADQKLPAWLVLKSDAARVARTEEQPSPMPRGSGSPDRSPDMPAGLVVQAEVGADGTVVYGVIFRHAIRMVRADEVERIEPNGRSDGRPRR